MLMNSMCMTLCCPHPIEIYGYQKFCIDFLIDEQLVLIVVKGEELI